MSDWQTVCHVDNLKVGDRFVFQLDDIDIIVFNLDNSFYAIEDCCTHDGGTLSSGEVEGDEIICPRHFASFSIKTGEVVTPPAFEAIHTFPVRVHEEIIQIRDDRFDS